MHDNDFSLNQTANEPHEFHFGKIKCSTHTIPQQIQAVRQLLHDRASRPRTILTVNAHIYNQLYTDTTLQKIFNAARIVTADGMSIVWAARLFHTGLFERANATEAFRAFLLEQEMPENTGVLIGCTEEEAAAAAGTIEAMSSHCRITRTVSGYLSDEQYRDLFATMGQVDFIYLGMGTPKTERIAALASALVPDAIIWGIGGGTIRIFAGTMTEAPVFWRRAGLQWLHRLISDPTALWKRYIIGNPLFLYRVFKARLLSA
ncbi:MAG: WecB/TagA/CpsF family glycosyltransferase [Candidatus Zhuqueibacterota bacterium]